MRTVGRSLIVMKFSMVLMVREKEDKVNFNGITKIRILLPANFPILHTIMMNCHKYLFSFSLKLSIVKNHFKV